LHVRCQFEMENVDSLPGDRPDTRIHG
jgi:hypothetical protein